MTIISKNYKKKSKAPILRVSKNSLVIFGLLFCFLTALLASFRRHENRYNLLRSPKNSDNSFDTNEAVVNSLVREKMDDKVAERIAKKWDEHKNTFQQGGAWHEHPLLVKTYQQRLASGNKNMVSHLLDQNGKKQNCLSIGCGDGGIEIDMVSSGLCQKMKGIDLSPVRIQEANSKIPPDLTDRVVFNVGNAENDFFGNEYDLVLFTHALHHIFDLEKMIDAITERILGESGILVLEEYVGPVRWQFPQHHLDYMSEFLKNIEKKYPHRVESLRKNPLWNGLSFTTPDAELVRKDDPSETVRSNEIIPVLSQKMNLIEDVPLGGNFFQWMFHNVYNSLKDDEGNKIVESMLETEMKLIKDGSLQSDYVFQVWKQRTTHD